MLHHNFYILHTLLMTFNIRESDINIKRGLYRIGDLLFVSMNGTSPFFPQSIVSPQTSSGGWYNVPSLASYLTLDL